MQKQSVIQIMTDIRNLLLLQKDLFTISEVCSYTGYEKSYIYKLCSSKIIPHYKSPGGKSLFFDKTEIINWLKSNPVVTKEEMRKKIESIRQANKR
mgnify:CR=1 FL=1